MEKGTHLFRGVELAESADTHINGIVIGQVVRAGGPVETLVDYPGNPTAGPVDARSTIEARESDVGRAVALAFERGDPTHPVILGFVVAPERDPWALRATRDSAPDDGSIEERVVIEGGKELVLRCGEASITLRKNGRVVIRGAYVETRARGVNRIKGGMVKIN